MIDLDTSYTLMLGHDDDGSYTLLGIYDTEHSLPQDLYEVRRQLEDWAVPSVSFHDVQVNPTAREALEAWTDDPESWLAAFSEEEESDEI